MAPASAFRSLLLIAALCAAAPVVHAERTMAFRDPVDAVIDEAPADIAAATLAAVALLRGMPGAIPSQVTVAPGVAEKLRDPHTRFEGFDLTSFNLSYVGPPRSGKPGRRIVGTLVFTDDTGRQAEQTYAIDYEFRRGGLLIQEARSEREPPPRPRVAMFAVPAERVPADFFAKLRPYGEMLAWLADNAIDVSNAATAKGPHHVFAVALDRLGPGDQLVIDEDKRVAQTRLDIGGWQIAVRRVESLAGVLPLRTAYRPGKWGWRVADVAVLPSAAATTRSAAPRPD